MAAGEEWTEDDIMSYGLAGEDEYVELVPDVSSAEECVLSPILESSNSMVDANVTKSGRVRKRPVKLIEMDEPEQQERKSVLKHSHKKITEETRSPSTGQHYLAQLPSDTYTVKEDSTPGFTLPLSATESSDLAAHSSSNKSSRQLSSQLGEPVPKKSKLYSKSKKNRPKGYTAYILWCNEQRAKIVSLNPDFDFSTISKRLGDIWHTVPQKEKMIWKRKAKQMSKKSSSMLSTGKTKVSLAGRPSTGRSRDLLLNKAMKYKEKLEAPSQTAFKVTGTSHIDVCAHLKLLGESLTVIGARLQEHKGQIAVQGSLSVLLDSLLCSLGPIMCLTNQIEELNGCPESVHASTLDNIAYIMPGVG